MNGKRGARRARVLLAAKIETPGGRIDGRLRDISRKGALIECATVPPAGTEVTFVRGKTTVPARIAWAADGRVGLEFHYMIDENELLVHIGRAKEPPASPPRYEGRSAITLGMNAKERKLAKAWSVTVGLNLPERGD
ncbi:PilZ domain-containing protein [Sphingosinicella sp. LHD-64]|uniref:PilZ domain-containing protein n=1 Tax=Sphingosinicella sp. LHD-64 TaxID=3072139 RepID=UPI00280F0411|nr:PilZ domain-containing protein [Sphingosinicella sp. LHD-64]MDQ8756294.1 PilZ domain-containing protein [Sphingosinicella sp. LHD-64]